MATVQLNFSLRTGPKCKTVHLIGSWNNYASQYPLAKDPTKSGGWKGTFKFTNGTLQQGQRYWYYYIIDGYHVSHDPARDSTTEPTTGRKLNILDIPAAKPSAATYAAPPGSGGTTRHSRHSSSYIPNGRALSPSQIQSPYPSKPYATRDITHFSAREMEALSRRYAAQQLSEVSSLRSVSTEGGSSDSEGYSAGSSPVPSLRSGSSRSSHNSSPSSLSSNSSCCTCERYAIKRDGTRIKLDCGGKRCGYSDSSSDCSSESEEEYRYRTQQTRRQGIVVRR